MGSDDLVYAYIPSEQGRTIGKDLGVGRKAIGAFVIASERAELDASIADQPTGGHPVERSRLVRYLNEDIVEDAERSYRERDARFKETGWMDDNIYYPANCVIEISEEPESMPAKPVRRGGIER